MASPCENKGGELERSNSFRPREGSLRITVCGFWNTAKGPFREEEARERKAEASTQQVHDWERQTPKAAPLRRPVAQIARDAAALRTSWTGGGRSQQRAHWLLVFNGPRRTAALLERLEYWQTFAASHDVARDAGAPEATLRATDVWAYSETLGRLVRLCRDLATLQEDDAKGLQ